MGFKHRDFYGELYRFHEKHIDKSLDDLAEDVNSLSIKYPEKFESKAIRAAVEDICGSDAAQKDTGGV